jgi:hypothetical protein
MESAPSWLFLARLSACRVGASILAQNKQGRFAGQSAQGRKVMLCKSDADGRKLAASTDAGLKKASNRTVDGQESVILSFALETRAGWQVSRRSNRPINLERRARFARIETA